MRTNILKIGLQCLALVFLMGLFACEGDIGPAGSQGVAGPAGPPGLNGLNGQDGQDGQNGAENCIDCHGNNQLITAKMFQWEKSVHAVGGHYVRNTASCAGCHTSQGFLDRLVTGEFVASGTVEDPLPINCYTCHQVHNTYTAADWALTASDPAYIWITDETVDFGNGNLCLNCHQPRIPSDGIPEVGQTGDFVIESSRYGPHHGAQGTMLAGVGQSGAYELGDGYENSFHRNVTNNACIDCHMAPVYDGREAGGHTFRVVTEGGELSENACSRCHTDEDELATLYTDVTTEITGLLEELGAILEARGIKRVGQDRSEPGTYDALVVGCYYNYIFVVEDQSLGVHNYKYTKTLLENSIAALQ